jgi:hypothetical protein
MLMKYLETGNPAGQMCYHIFSKKKGGCPENSTPIERIQNPNLD